MLSFFLGSFVRWVTVIGVTLSFQYRSRKWARYTAAALQVRLNLRYEDVQYNGSSKSPQLQYATARQNLLLIILFLFLSLRAFLLLSVLLYGVFGARLTGILFISSLKPSQARVACPGQLLSSHLGPVCYCVEVATERGFLCFKAT